MTEKQGQSQSQGPSQSLTKIKSKISIKFGQTKSLKDKIAENLAEKANLLELLDPKKAKHKIAIILDDSGSTIGEVWDKEVQATRQILNNSDYKDTSYVLYKLNEGLVQSLTCDYTEIEKVLPKFVSGATFIAYALDTMCTYGNPNFSLDRIILVSDGQPNDAVLIDQNIDRLIQAKIKVDTIFIYAFFPDKTAQELMQRIAAKTGGVYMTFDNMDSFQNAVGYLSPAQYHLLQDKKTRLLLGSKEG